MAVPYNSIRTAAIVDPLVSLREIYPDKQLLGSLYGNKIREPNHTPFSSLYIYVHTLYNIHMYIYILYIYIHMYIYIIYMYIYIYIISIHIFVKTPCPKEDLLLGWAFSSPGRILSTCLRDRGPSKMALQRTGYFIAGWCPPVMFVGL